MIKRHYAITSKQHHHVTAKTCVIGCAVRTV